MLKPILIVHPNDPTTRFLDKIKNHLVSTFEEKIHHFNIQYSDSSHNQCIERIEKHPENGLIIFLGHGRSDSLYGSKAPLYGNEFVSPDAIIEHPEEYYGKEVFIDYSNIEIFKGKKIFCLACNSNDKIARYAIEKGATSFFGFGDIPSSNGELKELGETDATMSLDRITQNIKTEINYIVKRSLEISIEKSYTFQELFEIFRFISNQRISDILVNKKDLKERKIIADYIYLLKSEIKIFGDINQKIS